MSDTQALLAANQAFYRAFQTKSLEAMSAIWANGINSICIHPGRPALKGWDQIRFSWDQIFRNMEILQLGIDVMTSEVRGTFGYVILAEKLVQGIQGQQIEVQSIATNLFENSGGSWRLLHRHASPILPMMPPPNQPMSNPPPGMGQPPRMP